MIYLGFGLDSRFFSARHDFRISSMISFQIFPYFSLVPSLEPIKKSILKTFLNQAAFRLQSAASKYPTQHKRVQMAMTAGTKSPLYLLLLSLLLEHVVWNCKLLALNIQSLVC